MLAIITLIKAQHLSTHCAWQKPKTWLPKFSFRKVLAANKLGCKMCCSKMGILIGLPQQHTSIPVFGIQAPTVFIFEFSFLQRRPE